MDYDVEEEDGRRVDRRRAGFIGLSPSCDAAAESSLMSVFQQSYAFGLLSSADRLSGSMLKSTPLIRSLEPSLRAIDDDRHYSSVHLDCSGLTRGRPRGCSVGVSRGIDLRFHFNCLFFEFSSRFREGGRVVLGPKFPDQFFHVRRVEVGVDGVAGVAWGYLGSV